MKKEPIKTKRKPKSEIIPKYGSLKRKLIIKVLYGTEVYKKSMKKGLPFYSKNELEKIEKKYADGMTWSEIDTELSKKGVIMKKATFRRYIQDKNISSATGYKKNEKGREAIYPPDVIEHINFIQYFYRMADDDFIFKLMTLLGSFEVSAMELVEDNLTEYSFFTTLMDNLGGHVYGSDDLEETFRHVLKDHPDFLEKVLFVYNDLVGSFNTKSDQLIKMLKDYEILPPFIDDE